MSGTQEPALHLATVPLPTFLPHRNVTPQEVLALHRLSGLVLALCAKKTLNPGEPNRVGLKVAGWRRAPACPEWPWGPWH